MIVYRSSFHKNPLVAKQMAARNYVKYEMEINIYNNNPHSVIFCYNKFSSKMNKMWKALVTVPTLALPIKRVIFMNIFMGFFGRAQI